MHQLKAIIIDDEERARTALSSLLKDFCQEVLILESCSNVPDGVLAINRNNPDVVFLDIEMPEYSGFELLNFFKEIDFEIIFVTAYNEYAIKAFEVSALDYLLKPVDIDKLKLAVEKAKSKQFENSIKDRINILKESFSGEQFNKIALPMSEGLLFVDTSDIVYLEADGAYTEVWLKNGSKILVSKKIKFFEEVLELRPNFFRSHRSYMVNINFIKRYNKSENTLALDNGKTIVISRDKKAEFEQQLKENNLTVG